MIYLAIHSYSQVWLTPWGWTSDLPPNYSDLVTILKASPKLNETNFNHALL